MRFTFLLMVRPLLAAFTVWPASITAAEEKKTTSVESSLEFWGRLLKYCCALYIIAILYCFVLAYFCKYFVCSPSSGIASSTSHSPAQPHRDERPFCNHLINTSIQVISYLKIPDHISRQTTAFYLTKLTLIKSYLIWHVLVIWESISTLSFNVNVLLSESHCTRICSDDILRLIFLQQYCTFNVEFLCSSLNCEITSTLLRFKNQKLSGVPIQYRTEQFVCTVLYTVQAVATSLIILV